MRIVRLLSYSFLAMLGLSMVPISATAAIMADWEITIPSSLVLVPDEAYTLTGTFKNIGDQPMVFATISSPDPATLVVTEPGLTYGAYQNFRNSGSPGNFNDTAFSPGPNVLGFQAEPIGLTLLPGESLTLTYVTIALLPGNPVEPSSIEFAGFLIPDVVSDQTHFFTTGLVSIPVLPGTQNKVGSLQTFRPFPQLFEFGEEETIFPPASPIESSTVPEPSSLFLLGPGLLGALGFERRSRNSGKTGGVPPRTD